MPAMRRCATRPVEHGPTSRLCPSATGAALPGDCRRPYARRGQGGRPPQMSQPRRFRDLIRNRTAPTMGSKSDYAVQIAARQQDDRSAERQTGRAKERFAQNRCDRALGQVLQALGANPGVDKAEIKDFSAVCDVCGISRNAIARVCARCRAGLAPAAFQLRVATSGLMTWRGAPAAKALTCSKMSVN